MQIHIILLSLVFLSTAVAEVGNDDLKNIRDLAASGKYEEALQAHLRFHEESKRSAGMGGVRLSFALSQWLELGQKYPKALDSLKNIRDQHEESLLSGKGGFPEFHEYLSINRTLKEDEKTYTLFKQLHAKHPDIAATCFHAVLDLVVAHKDYELCGVYITDPIKSYEDIRHMRELNLSIAKTNPAMGDAAFQDYTDRTFVEGTSQLIDVMVNLKRFDEAKEIQKRALGYLPDQKLKDALRAK